MRGRRTFRQAHDELARQLDDVGYLQMCRTYERAREAGHHPTRSNLNVVVSVPTWSELPAEAQAKVSKAAAVDGSKGAALGAYESWRHSSSSSQNARTPSASDAPAATSTASWPARRHGLAFKELLKQSYPYTLRRTRDAEPEAHRLLLLSEAAWASLRQRFPELLVLCDSEDADGLRLLLAKATNKGRGSARRPILSLGDIRDPAINPTLDMLDRAMSGEALDTRFWVLLREMNVLAAAELAEADLNNVIVDAAGGIVEPSSGCALCLRRRRRPLPPHAFHSNALSDAAPPQSTATATAATTTTAAVASQDEYERTSFPRNTFINGSRPEVRESATMPSPKQAGPSPEPAASATVADGAVPPGLDVRQDV